MPHRPKKQRVAKSTRRLPRNEASVPEAELADDLRVFRRLSQVSRRVTSHELTELIRPE